MSKGKHEWQINMWKDAAVPQYIWSRSSPTRWANIMKSDSSNIDPRRRGVGVKENINAWWKFKLPQPLRQAVCPYLIKLNICISYSLMILPLCVFREPCTCEHLQREICTRLLTVVFVQTENWKSAQISISRRMDKSDMPHSGIL